MIQLANNLRLFEKKFSMLQEISTALVVTDNINAIANLMLDLAVNYTEAEKGSLMLLNERDELTILAGRGGDPLFQKSYRAKIGEGIAGVVALNRTAVLVEDIANEAQFHGMTHDRYKTRSFISCPIVSKNKLLGVLNINDKLDGSPFTEDEFSLVKIIANQSAIALENAMLVNQLRYKAAELEGINRKLIESDMVKTEFITRVSHELRTPLNSIKGSVYYLQQSERLSHHEQLDFYDIISGETDKLTAIVENQLDFLRFEDETMIMNKTVVSLRDLLKEVVASKSLQILLSRKGIAVEVTSADDVPDIVGDRIRVVQFFMNMIEGLSHFLERGDTITVSVSENDQVDVAIRLPRRLPDNILPFLFSSNHLFQSDYPDEKLKLYLARKVVDLHRWDLTTDNAPSGMTVSLAIPKSARQKAKAVLTTTIDMFLEFIAEVLDLNTCSIMLCDEISGDLVIKSARGLDDFLIKQTRVRPGERIAGWVALEGKPLFIDDIETDPRFGRRSIPQYTTKSLISLPLKADDRVIGVLNLNNKRSSAPFTSHDFDIASRLGDRLSYFIERLQADEQREDDYRHLVTSLDSLITAEKRYHKKDPFLPELTAEIVRRLGMSEDVRRDALYASMIYDLGLVLLGDGTLNKKEALLPAERSTLRVHPFTTLGLLDSFEFSEEVKRGILHHHERFDGKGYPDGLAGEDIPLVSRVLAVVDSYCALTSNRPYRSGVRSGEAIKQLEKGAGTFYDPRIVAVLATIINGPRKEEKAPAPVKIKRLRRVSSISHRGSAC